jgi:hypothetical protein
VELLHDRLQVPAYVDRSSIDARDATSAHPGTR